MQFKVSHFPAQKSRLEENLITHPSGEAAGVAGSSNEVMLRNRCLLSELKPTCCRGCDRVLPPLARPNLNGAVVDALADATVRQRFEGLGLEIPTRELQTPEALGAFQQVEIEKWWPIIKAANIKGE